MAVNEEKKDPRDFALWKVDPKHQMQWDAPFRGGVRGFPGWHIECSAMSMHYLGPQIDVHTGGEDNMFPHHECEIAQTEAHTGKPFVGVWMHARHLLVDGTKMSKSLGNFFTVEDVLQKGYTGLELRYALIRVQYRQSLNFTLKGLDEARSAIGRVQQCRQRLARIRDGAEPAGAGDLAPPAAAANAAFTAAMSEDLNVSEALAAVFEFVGLARRVGAVVGPGREDVGGAARALRAHQMRDTAARHFAGQEDLLLVGFRESDLAGLRWEPSRGGDLFPHVYGPIATALAVSVAPLPLEGGLHRFPEDAA